MAPQAFKKPPQAPPLFTATPSSLIEDTKRIIDNYRGVQDKVVASIKPSDATFQSVVLPMAVDENKFGLESHILGFYQSVSTNQALRDSSTEAEQLMDDFSIESSMREDIYKLVDAALKNNKEELDPESQRLLEKDYKSYIRNGLGLPEGPKRDRFKEIKKRLSQISIIFQKNLNEEKGGIWFTPKQLDGVPEDVLSGLAKGEGEHDGKLFLTFKYPDLFPAVKYAKSSETRKKVFIENENKCNQNVPLFKEAIVLRDEAARLLGYPNHAAFRIEDKMMKTAKTVDEFLGDLRQRLTKGGAQEREVLKSLKEKDVKERGAGEDYDGRYFLWDHRFYDRMLLEQDYQLDAQKIAEYFPLQTTVHGMLEIFEQLFGLVFVEITEEDRASISPTNKGEDLVWHPEVKLFSVWDDEGEGSGFVGYLYLDMHPREGKYGHAANFNIQPGFIDTNGSRRYPATALVCNFSKPTAKKPSLLKHDEVVTLFHELGHGIHDLVSRTIYSRFHGTSTVRDFVEAPSQMLENWCWTPSQLKALSHHYSSLSPEYMAAWQEQAKATSSSSNIDVKPEEKIPDELISKLIKTKHVNDALSNLRQLHFGIFDMSVHEPANHEAVEKLKVSEKYNSLRKEICQMDGPEVLGQGDAWGNGEATFGHLIGGYDAGYYGYLSSQVYSADMFFSVFAKDPMNPKEGRRYRHTVLERGGSQDEMQTLEDFLGRKPNTEAFYRELGLA
ncbi:metallopeptidase [Lasallia pustulata]|uniref:Metallopeptidase n=1 Tax=Lasallia pustulata TaxID=136370 RepID=A0A1W5DCB1_9LECA|nr:metallopeptidase [Lasallia pustulata]